MMAVPVAVSPVKVIAATPGCRVSNSPADPSPRPWTTLYTPEGTPTVCITSPSRVAVAGVSSDGFTTTVLPQASAGATFHVISSSGRFQGQKTAITPFGGHILDGIGEDAEVGCPSRDVHVRGDGPRLAGVVNFGIEKIIETPIDLPRHPVQHVGALRQGQPAPGT